MVTVQHARPNELLSSCPDFENFLDHFSTLVVRGSPRVAFLESLKGVFATKRK